MKRVKLILTAGLLVLLISGCAGPGGKPKTAQDLFDRHVDAVFGGQGMDAIESVTMRGTLHVDDFGIEAPIVTKIMAPDHMVFETNVMGMALSQGCNSDECWMQQPGQGVSTAEGEMQALLRQQADSRQWENIDQYYEILEIVPAQNPDESTVYTVRAVNEFGREHYYHFAKDTGLLQSYTVTVDSPMGVITQTYTNRDYQDFDGILWPTEVEQTSPMSTARVVTESVSYEPLSPSDFQRPE